MIILMILIWTGAFVAAKVALRELSPLTLAPLRAELAALVMLALYFTSARRGRAPKTSTPFDRRDVWRFFWIAVASVVCNQMLFTIGLNHTSVGHSALIIGTGPITILLASRAMRLELLTVNKLLGMVLSLGGVMILALEKGMSLQAGTLKGDLITLAGSLAFALYTVLSKRLAPKYDTFTMNLYVSVIGGVVLLPLAVWRACILDWGAVSWKGWAGLLYMGLLGSVVAYLIYYWALRHLAPSRLAAFTYFQPVLATILGMAVLGEQLTHNLLAGGALVLVGVYLAERMPRRKAMNDN
jgi:drug/metabolite transporter (DMT)-like permease